jgi:hypothetical protein
MFLSESFIILLLGRGSQDNFSDKSLQKHKHLELKNKLFSFEFLKGMQ